MHPKAYRSLQGRTEPPPYATWIAISRLDGIPGSPGVAITPGVTASPPLEPRRMRSPILRLLFVLAVRVRVRKQPGE